LKQKAIIFSKLKIVSIQVFKNIVHNQICKSFQTPPLVFPKRMLQEKKKRRTKKKKRGRRRKKPFRTPWPISFFTKSTHSKPSPPALLGFFLRCTAGIRAMPRWGSWRWDGSHASTAPF
jgi:hypothetical protein